MAAAALVLSGGCARNTGSHSQYLLFFNVACMCLFDSNRVRAGVLFLSKKQSWLKKKSKPSLSSCI